MKKWVKGTGLGWVWEAQDEVGSLNEMTDASKLAAFKLAKSGKTDDLSVSYDRDSFKWPGHSPGQIMTFPMPEGVIHQGLHIEELHNLEDLAADRVYQFAYICSTNKMKETTAGFTLRPPAIR